jgi:hypothetical protein
MNIYRRGQDYSAVMLIEMSLVVEATLEEKI